MKVWIFQGNPDDYDIDGAIRDLERIDWYAPVEQGGDQVREGHIALMWRSPGRKTRAAPGTIGVGRTRLDTASLLAQEFSPTKYLLEIRSSVRAFRRLLEANKVQ